MPYSTCLYSLLCKHCDNIIGATYNETPAMLRALESARDAYCDKCGREGRIIKARKNNSNAH